MKRRLIYMLAAALMGFIPAHAQTDSQGTQDDNPVISYSGSKKRYEIADIAIVGMEESSHKTVLRLSGLETGQRIDVPGPEVTAAMKKLWATGLFANVSIRAAKTQADKIWLEIDIEQHPKVKEVNFEGVKKGEASELRDKIGLFPGSQISQNALDRSEKLIKKYLNEKGYKEAEVHVRQGMADEDGLAYVNVNIDKKDKCKVRTIHISGNTALSDKDIKKVMKKTNEKGYLRDFFHTKKFVEDEFENDIDNIYTRYSELGYRDACILKDSVSLNSLDGTVDIWLEIDEGTPYYLRNLEWVGNSVFSGEELDRILGMKKGDVYNQKKLNDRVNMDQDAIQKVYYNKGYVTILLNPVEANVIGDSIDVEVRISEGPQATINRVTITGNDQVYENVVRRELYTRPGDIFSYDAFMRTFNSIGQMGHFDPQSISPDVIPDEINGTVDINWNLESKANDKLELSVGYGQTGLIFRGGVTFTNFSTYNLFHKSDNYHMLLPQGDGQTLSLSAQSNAEYYHSYSIQFIEPWLGGKRPNSLSLGMFYSKQSDISSTYYNSAYYQNLYNYAYGYGNYNYGGYGYYDNYESYYDPDKYIALIGGSIGWGKRLHWPDDYFQIYTELSYTRYKLKQWSYFLINNGTCNNINLGITLSRNSTNNSLYPTMGSEFAVSVSATPPYSLFDNVDYEHLASDRTARTYQEEMRRKHKWIEYNKWKFHSKTYTSLTHGIKRNLVLMTRFDFGLLGHYNKYKKSPFETFFVGGDGMSSGSYTYATETVGMRGYENGSLTPYNDGYAYTRMTAELRYPLMMESSATIYALTFFEGGNCWDSISKFNPFELKRSVGVGARIFLPVVGLMGIDWAYGLDPIMGSRQYGGSQIHFILGQEF